MINGITGKRFNFLSIGVAMKSNIVASDINTATVEPYDKSDNVVEATAEQADRCVESPQYIAEQQMQASSNSLRSILLAYYSLIDSGAIDEALSLFSEDATYMRCESLYSGIAEIEHFYRNERKIRGSHELKNLWVIERTGIVEGIFSGRGIEGQSKHVGFADIFIFNQSGKISNRHTYLQLQSSYVKE
jgi:ketosteroid isomerase-like protein